MESKYLKAFQALKETCPDSYRTIGDGIWVEEIKEEEAKTKSGLVIAKHGSQMLVDGVEANRPMLVWILEVGEGYYDEDTGEDVPVEVKSGYIALVSKLSVNWVSVFGGILAHDGPRLGFTREAEIKHYWKGIDAYQLYFATLKKGLGL